MKKKTRSKVKKLEGAANSAYNCLKSWKDCIWKSAIEGEGTNWWSYKRERGKKLLNQSASEDPVAKIGKGEKNKMVAGGSLDISVN